MNMNYAMAILLVLVALFSPVMNGFETGVLVSAAIGFLFMGMREQDKKHEHRRNNHE